MKYILNRIRRINRYIFIKLPNYKKVKNKDISIISSNCIGGLIYSDCGLKFNSMTINLYFKAEDFIKFVEKMDYYINLTLDEIELDNVKYPVGKLDDIIIHFVHYKSFKEANEKWNSRKKRLNYNKLIINLLC